MPIPLKDFIEATLSDICEAVENVRSNKHYVAPQYFVDPSSPGKATAVEFDVAVSVSDSSNFKEDKKGGVKVAIFSSFKAGADMGTEAGSETTHETSNRVKFSVPVYFQYDKEKREKIQRRIEQQNQEARKPVSVWEQ